MRIFEEGEVKGSNTLEINEATMIEAVQEYFDRRLVEFARVSVKSVKKKRDAGHCELFSVCVEELERDLKDTNRWQPPPENTCEQG